MVKWLFLLYTQSAERQRRAERKRAAAVNGLHGRNAEEACSTFSTCARRSASHGSVCVVMFELLWIPKLSLDKLYIV